MDQIIFHYLSSPALSSDEMLKEKCVKLDFISDIDLYQFIEKVIKGGVGYIAQTYNKANNKYMKSCDKDKLCKYMIYEDANNLYGWAMSQYLHLGGFKCLTKKMMPLK